MRKSFISLLIIAVMSFGGVNAVMAESPSHGATKREVITVPEGQVLRTIVTTPLSSDHLSLGQNVTMVMGEDFYYNGKLVAPIDSMVNGSVIKVSRACENNTGELTLRFTRITTPEGVQVPVSAVVKNDNRIGKITSLNTGFVNANGDIEVPVTSPLDIVLTQPITVNPEKYNMNY